MKDKMSGKNKNLTLKVIKLFKNKWTGKLNKKTRRNYS